MATLDQIKATYDYLDDLIGLDIERNGEVSCAFFDGDFTRSIEQAQRDKHAFILASLGFREGFRLLDIGCGWGPLLKTVKEQGGRGVGITLSPKQAAACTRRGLDARLLDWRDLDVEALGPFDGIASVGSFEHFCSVEQHLAGQQEQVYDAFFHLCRRLLPAGGRLYLQTMTWGKNAVPYSAVSLKAEKGSNEYILAVLEKQYPGSWLPAGVEQIERCAAPYLQIVTRNNGRLDYIETMNRWGRIWRWSPSTTIIALKMLPTLVRDPDFRYKLEALRNAYNKECFQREVMDHQRLVLEAVP